MIQMMATIFVKTFSINMQTRVILHKDIIVLLDIKRVNETAIGNTYTKISNNNKKHVKKFRKKLSLKRINDLLTFEL